ncbi:MAG: stage V sporulation protein AD [Bacilli bacterium]|nr:stage V sporulation protein AD [Bacilli bacterium]
MLSKKVNNVYLHQNYGIAGKNENNHVLKDINFLKDFYGGEDSVETCEIKMNEIVLENLINDHTNLVIGGNLDNQLTGVSYALKNRNLAYLGIYNACATFTEGLIIGSKFCSKKDLIVLTSSHNLISERQFKYPIEYGSPNKDYATFTTTGSIGVILSNRPSNIRLECYTIGDVIDYEVYDASNMGAVMAPGAYHTIIKHLKDFKRDITYYDLILTGDLGKYGLMILKELLKKDNITTSNIIDAGSLLYPLDDDKAGGSGPVCLPLILFKKVLFNKKYQRILLVGTGALHSKVLVDQHLPIPTIAHAVAIEVIE